MQKIEGLEKPKAVSITEEQFEAYLIAKAKDPKLTFSAWVRSIIDEHLKKTA